MSTSKMQLIPMLRSDKLEASIELHQDGVPLGHMLVDAFTFETVIHELAAAREQMAEIVPPALDAGDSVKALIDPAWRIDLRPDGNVVLALRHPGLGWLGFLLPPNEASHMAAALEGRATGSTPDPQTGPNTSPQNPTT